MELLEIKMLRTLGTYGTSLVAQMVKHLPTMQETWVQSLGREDPLEKEMATHSSILAWKIPWTDVPGRLQSVHGVTKSRTRLSGFTSLHFLAPMIKNSPANAGDIRDVGSVPGLRRSPGGRHSNHSSILAFNFLKVLTVVKYTNKTYHLIICKHTVQPCLYIHCCATNLQKFFHLTKPKYYTH